MLTAARGHAEMGVGGSYQNDGGKLDSYESKLIVIISSTLVAPVVALVTHAHHTCVGT